MSFTQLFAQATRATGLDTTVTRNWPQGAQQVDIKIDIWGAGGAADPWTGILHPFSDPALRAEVEFLAEYADGRIESRASAQWVGHADGNFGSSKPGGTPTEPIISVTFVVGAELPTIAHLRVHVIQGPITAGLSYQTE